MGILNLPYESSFLRQSQQLQAEAFNHIPQLRFNQPQATISIDIFDLNVLQGCGIYKSWRKKLSIAVVTSMVPRSSRSWRWMRIRQSGSSARALSSTSSSKQVRHSRRWTSTLKIQHFGARKDESGTKDVKDDKESLKSIEVALERAKEDYMTAEEKLKVFYGDE